MAVEATTPTTGFTVLRRTEVPVLQAQATLVRHETGAELLHLECGDPVLRATVAVPTRTDDDCGKPHTLEHCLFGPGRTYADASQLSPRAALIEGQGAWTSPESTHFHVGSRDPEAFLLGLDVRLDQLLDPLFPEEYFHHQAHRLEFDDPDDPTTPLQYRGIIFNEQTGITGVPLVVGGRAVEEVLFAGTHVERDHGGRPDAIVDLTHEAMRRFHADFYHPGAVRIVTWGAVTVEEILPTIDRALRRPAPRERTTPPAQRARRTGPRTARLPMAVAEGSDPRAGMVMLAWATAGWDDPYAILLHELAERLLVRGAEAVIPAALARAGLGTGSVASFVHYGWRYAEQVLATGVQGVDPDLADTVMETALGAVSDLVANGVDGRSVDALAHRFELDLRALRSHEGSSPQSVFLARVIPAWIHAGDPLSVLDVVPLLERLRAEEAAGLHPLARFLQERVIDNPDRVTVALVPDPGGEVRREREQRARLDAIAASLDDAGREEIRQRSQRVAQYMAGRGSGPALDLALLPRQVRLPELHVDQVDDTEVAVGEVLTRGITHLDLLFDLGDLPDDLVDDLGLFSRALVHAGIGGGSVEATATRTAAAVERLVTEVVSGLSADGERWSPRLRLTAVALESRHTAACALLGDLLAHGRLDEELVARILPAALAEAQQSVFPRAADRVNVAAAALVRESAGLRHRVEGLGQLVHLRALAAEPSRLAEAAERLERIRTHLARRGRVEVCAAVSGAAARADLLAALRGALDPLAPGGSIAAPRRDGRPSAAGGAVQAWTGGLPNAFNAEDFRLPGLGCEDATAAMLAVHYAGSLHVTPEVVSKGTAYHAYGIADPGAGVGRFFSVRDPNLDRTFTAYRVAVRRVIDEPVDASLLDGGRVMLRTLLDPPVPAEERVRLAWEDRLAGLDPEARTRRTTEALTLPAAAVQEAARRHLLGGGGRVTMASPTMLAAAPPGLTETAGTA